MKIDFLKIKAACNPPKGKKQDVASYTSSIERLIKDMISEVLFAPEILPPHFISYESYFQRLNQNLPLLQHSSLEMNCSFVTIALLCTHDLTEGVGRFFIDKITRSLIPGKNLHFSFHRSLSFHFIIQPKQKYFVTEIGIEIQSNKELESIRMHLPKCLEDIRLTLLAVRHARKLVQSKPLTFHEKHMILLENLTTLVDQKKEKLDHSILEEMNHLLLKVKHQEKSDMIPDHLLPLVRQAPQVFDLNIYSGIQSLVSIFNDAFTFSRDLHHLYRIFSYLYLFHKLINHQAKSNPHKHYSSLKILRTFSKSKSPALAILICVNMIKEKERLHSRNLIEVVQSYLSKSCLIEDSQIFHARQEDQIHTLYFELKRKDGISFPYQEIKELKKRLSKEILKQIEYTKAPHVHDHTEQQLNRNILTLSKAVQSPQEAPPVIINYLSETDHTVSFVIIFVGMRTHAFKPKDYPHLNLLSHQTKFAGILNQKHLQIAHILKIKVNKDPFVSPDTNNFSFSLVRKHLLSFLKESFGPIRDFDSGIIVKQYENLSKLKAFFPSSPIIDPFFYSLSPGSMQSILSTQTLSLLHDMLQEAANFSFGNFSYHLKSQSTEEELLIAISSPSDQLIDQLKEQIRIFVQVSTHLTISDFSHNGIRLLAIVFPLENADICKHFQNQLVETIKSLDPELAQTL